MQALVLAAGKGTRMKSDWPKVLQRVFDRPIVDYVLETLRELGVKNPKVVIGSGAEQVKAFLREKEKKSGFRCSVLLQKEQKGTGHAVMMARAALARSEEDLLIWPGDMPLVGASTIKAFMQCHREAGADLSVLSALQVEPAGYGRILRAGGKFYAIREELDATEAERRVQETNTGVYLARAKSLFAALQKIRPENKKQEYYLTDVIELLSEAGKKIEAFPLAAASEAQGINTRLDLAEVIQKMNQREIRKHQEAGVTFVSPEQTYVAPGVKIGKDTTVYPWSYIEADVRIGERCEIGPFVKVRKGTRVGNDSTLGSFVEVNRSKIGNKVLAKHLAYLGDAEIGDETNIGAGVITANFDGVRKHSTRIGKKVLVGSDTVFVAPVVVGDHAKTGAGAVVTRGTKIKRGETFAGVPARALQRKGSAKHLPRKKRG